MRKDDLKKTILVIL